MRKLHRVELLIIDDLALHQLEATETSDFYELIVERHRQASTVITSNREPPEILTMRGRGSNRRKTTVSAAGWLGGSVW